jgi:hypothetical protein
MLSALVQYLNESDAGPGFFDLAQPIGLLRSGDNDRVITVWKTGH